MPAVYLETWAQLNKACTIIKIIEDSLNADETGNQDADDKIIGAANNDEKETTSFMGKVGEKPKEMETNIPGSCVLTFSTTEKIEMSPFDILSISVLPK